MTSKNKIQSVYIESSVISYLTSKPSNDLFVLAKQHMTVLWWDRVLPHLNAYVSEYVLEEILKGDKEASKKRANASKDFPVLNRSGSIDKLAQEYLKAAQLPKEARLDAQHIASATIFALNYLVTWNCAHIANAFIRKKIEKVNLSVGLETPVICTPEELWEIPK